MASAFQKITFLAIISLSASFSALSDELYQVEVIAPPEIKEMVNQYTDLITQRQETDLDQELIDAMAATAYEQIANFLKTEGYFQPKIDIQQQDAKHWNISVDPGPPILVNETLLAVDGAIKNDPEYSKRLEEAESSWTLKKGDQFKQSEWAQSKKAALLTLTRSRYPLAKLSESRALIDPETHKVMLVIHVDSGPEIRFGPIEVAGNKRYPAKIVSGMADFSVGSPYDEKKLLDYQNMLEQDAHYSNAIVVPNFKKMENGRVPLEVTVTEVPRQKIELGLNYSTADGTGFRIGYDHYNIFKRGYTGSLVADIKRDEKKVALGLAFPRQANNYSHTINFSYTDSLLQRVKTKASTAGAWRIREHGDISSRFGLEYTQEKTSIEAGETKDEVRYIKKAHALLGTFAWTKRVIDDPLRPREGYLIDTSLSATPGSLGSSTTLIRGYFKSGYYLTPWPSKYGTLVSQMELGQVWASSAKNIPETLLFRTGGSSSVRGYEYHSLGVKDGRAIRGGRVLAVGSIEYQVPVAKDWATGPFYDFGNAADTWGNYSIASSYGLSVKWFSPIAPISFDVANAVEDKRVRWNIRLGLAF